MTELTQDDLVDSQYSGEVIEAKRSRLTPIRFREILMSSAPPCVVDGLIPRGGLVVVWGPPKSGKSYWTFDLVMHIALAWEYRGRCVEQGPVVYVAAEGATGLRNRIQAFRQEHLDNGNSDPPFYLVPDALNLVSDCAALIAAIERSLGVTKPVAVVLDTLNRSMAGSENDPADMAAYIKAADALRDTFGCAVVVVHHCGTEGSRPRGHTSLTGAADAQLAVKRDGAGLITVTVEWMKDGPEGDTIASRLETVEVGRDTNGGSITACTVTAADGEAPKAGARRQKMSAKQTRALDCLKNCMADMGQPSPGGPHYPEGVRVVAKDQWREFLFQSGVLRQDAANPRQDFARLCDQLAGRNVMREWSGQVWLCE